MPEANVAAERNLLRVEVGRVVKERRGAAAEFVAGVFLASAGLAAGVGAGEVGTDAVFVGKGAGEAPVAAAAENGVVANLPLGELLALRELERLAEVERRLREGKEVSLTDMKRLAAAEKERAREAAALSGEGKRGTEIDVACGDEGLRAWWVNGGGDAGFHVFAEEQWLEVPERTLKVMLRRAGVVEEALSRGEVTTEMEKAILYIREKRTLDKVAAGLAGYRRGVYHVGGRRILVQTEAQLLEPVKGEWKFIDEFLTERLRLEGTGDDGVQVRLFCYWLKRAVENLYRSPDSWLNSQVLILAGKGGCGKSQIQHRIITPLLGGRKADPSKYLFGGTQFNEGWIGCEHLLVEDPRPSTKLLDRLQLAQILKSLVVNEEHTLEAKHRGEFAVDPQFVVTLSINDDPDAMRVLPMLTPDVADKVMMFHVQKRPFSMATRTGAERKAFRDRITAELPAFLYFLLNECEVPEELQDDRFGVKEWHHGELKMNLWEEAPSAELLGILDVGKFKRGEATWQSLWECEGGGTWQEVAARWGWLREGEGAASGRWTFKRKTEARELVLGAAEGNYRLWVGKAKDLEAILERSESAGTKNWLKHNSVGRALGRLAEDCAQRVVRYRHGDEGERYFIVRSGVAEDADGV